MDTGNRVFEIGLRGNVTIFDANGTTTYSISESGAVASDPVAASFTTAVGFEITASDGNIWFIDASLDGNSNVPDVPGGVLAGGGTGTTVILPTTITAVMDGQAMTFIKTDTGTTPVVLWAGATSSSGVSIFDASGVTNDEFDIDAQGNNITIVPDFTNQIYWVEAVQEI